MIPYFFMEVKCIGNTQIIHLEETGITQRTIRLKAEFWILLTMSGPLIRNSHASKYDTFGSPICKSMGYLGHITHIDRQKSR